MDEEDGSTKSVYYLNHIKLGLFDFVPILYAKLDFPLFS